MTWNKNYDLSSFPFLFLLIFYFVLENHFKESDVLVPDAAQLLLKEFEI